MFKKRQKRCWKRKPRFLPRKPATPYSEQYRKKHGSYMVEVKSDYGRDRRRKEH